MSDPVGNLLELLDIEQLELDLFRGQSPDERANQRVFGGQVIAQALVAARPLRRRVLGPWASGPVREPKTARAAAPAARCACPAAS